MPFRGNWQPGTQYNYDDAVEYQGSYYKIIQPHRSQGDWPPAVVPALWGRTDESFQGHQAQDCEPQHRPPPQCGGFTVNPSNQGGGYKAPDGQQVTHEESQKHWYDLDDNKKKELMVGGGLALGLGLLGGGFYAHEKHEKKEDKEREAQAWELQNWVLQAQKHSDEWYRGGAPGTAVWVFSGLFKEHPELAQNAVQSGQEDGQPWFTIRAPHQGSMQVGKGRLQRGNEYGYIGYGGEAIMVKQFEVLIGPSNAFTWVKCHKNFNPSGLEYEPVEGGKDGDGSKIFVARVNHKGATHPGKCSEVLRGGYFTYSDDEKSEDDYEVLCVLPPQNRRC